MKRKRFLRLLSAPTLTVLLLILMLGSSMPPYHTYASPQEYPVPRSEAVIFETTVAFTVFDSANPFTPMGSQWASGWHQLAWEYDWYPNFATGEAILWRITGWEYQDNYTTFILHIRKGVTWNDGEPYTARDIAFTLDTLYKEMVPNALVIEYVESVEVPDNYTAIIHLKKPNPRIHYWFQMWGGFYIVPEHIWKDVNATTFKNWPPVDTGPYKLYGAYPDLKMFIWERRDDYWGKALGVFPAPKYAIFRQAPPPDISLKDFVAGQLDIPTPYSFTWDHIKKAKELTDKMVSVPFRDLCPLGISAINTEKYPLNLTEVRWAISYIIDRDTLARTFPMAETTSTAKYPWPIPGYPMFDKYVPMAEKALQRIKEELGFTFEYNPTKAVQILDDLGFIDRDGDGWRDLPNGTKISWEIVSRSPAVIVEYYVAEHLAAQLRKIGIDAHIRAVDPSMWHELTMLGYYDIAVGVLCTSAWLTGDIVYALDMLHSKYYAPIGQPAGGGIHGANPRYKNPELDSIVDQLWNMNPDDPKAQPLYEEGIYIMMRDLVCIPAIEMVRVMAFSTAYWTGWPTEIDLYQAPWWWVPSFMFVLVHLKPVMDSVWLLEDVEAFTGVEGKSYGPFKAGEYATIPKADAERLIKEGLASHSPPIADLINGLKSLRAQMSTLMTVVAIEGIAIIALVVALIIRRKPV